ncbi:WecB/TagA/CpsF family glycosyltransferase [Candidatus Nomurabacteria bacterium]|nr:WecB/TagA/CpsF family glycosyltransferase [Candidatus Nomurabacteria bacterium]
MQEFEILGVKVNYLPEHLAKELLFDFLTSDQQHQIATVNPEFILEAQKNKKFKTILKETSLATIDGTGIIWALQLNGHKVSLNHRLTGVRLTEMLLQIASIKGYKVLFCLREDGFTKPEKLYFKLKEKYPNLEFQVAIEKEAILKGQILQPEILLVGLGAPKQEEWIAENLTRLSSVKIAAGIGGAVDFLSEAQKRAPKIFSSFGLEWFWRLIKQPNRLKRIFRATIIFPFLVIKNKLEKN